MAIALPEIVTLFSLLVYMFTVLNVGRARTRYKITPPLTTGNENFDRYYRVQMNTLEQIVIFLPTFWLFIFIWSASIIASVAGFTWIIGRILYAIGYYSETKKRVPGFLISLLATSFLLVGALAGIIKNLLGI